MRIADAAVLRAIVRDVLDPEVVRTALAFALRELRQPDVAAASRHDRLKPELASLDAELARYAEAVAEAGPLPTILQAVKTREERR